MRRKKKRGRLAKTALARLLLTKQRRRTLKKSRRKSRKNDSRRQKEADAAIVMAQRARKKLRRKVLMQLFRTGRVLADRVRRNM